MRDQNLDHRDLWCDGHFINVCGVYGGKDWGSSFQEKVSNTYTYKLSYSRILS